MAGVNKVILLGNLGSDPEVKYLEGGSVVARFNIATSESYTNRAGERVEQWDNLAKIAEQYLKKGNQAYIEGKIKSETWTDKDGQQRTGIRIRATTLQLVGGGGGSRSGGEMAESGAASGGGQAASAARPAPAPKPAVADTPPPFQNSGGSGEDDLPF
jgi:single-strand DNA-binding protein